MANKKNIWVSPRTEGWAVKREGAEREVRVMGTKAEAERFARQLGRGDQVEVFIQNRDGTIGQRESYGHDPHPPRDREH